MNQQTSAPGFGKHPDYQVAIEKTSDHVRVIVGDQVLLDTRAPLLVQESKHHPVWYLPFADIDESLVSATGHSTYCPFKGHASYWTIRVADQVLENSVWAYQDPYLECLPLKDHVAFYTDKVALEINGELLNPQAPGWST